MSYKHIIVATDGSPLSNKGVLQAIALAKKVGAKLTAVHVSEPYPTYDIASSMGLFLDAAAVQSYYETVDRLGEEILAKAKDAAEAEGLTCATRYIGKSRPADGILQAAEATDADLIMLTSNGRRGLERMVLGSVASEVATRSKVSVTIMR